MSEWTKQSITDLINEYKEQRSLYDSKHSLYYNKKSRLKGLVKIAEVVSKTRPNTTCEEVQKKIQTIRTQLLQEVSKIERSKEHDDEALMYVPKVWWYSKLEWITQFMKSRNDPATPLSTRLDKSSKLNQSTYDIYNDEEENEDGSRIEVEEEEDSYKPTVKRARRATSDQQTRTIQYIISNEDTAEIIAPQEEIVEIQPHSQSDGDNERYKKRSKNFGKYVASLMQDLKDDTTFFETQTEILQVIQKATLKRTAARSNK